MESIRLWLVIEREDDRHPWRFTAASIKELERFELNAKKEKGAEAPQAEP